MSGRAEGTASSTDQVLALLDEVVLPSARGGRRPAEPLTVSLKRSLTSEDLPLLLNPPPAGSAVPAIAALRHSHHQLAQLLSKGMTEGEASLMTGYSLSRISVLKHDPAFAELLAHYNSLVEVAFVDLIERCKVAGLSAVDELMHRLEEEPGKWSRRELMEFAELMLDRGGALPGGKPGGGGGAPGVNIAVSFVTAGQQASPPGVTIDQEPSR